MNGKKVPIIHIIRTNVEISIFLPTGKVGWIAFDSVKIGIWGISLDSHSGIIGVYTIAIYVYIVYTHYIQSNNCIQS